MSRKTKPNPKLNQLISEFEGPLRSLSPKQWTEKSFNKLIQHYEVQGSISNALEVVELAIQYCKSKVSFYIIKARLLMAQFRFDEAMQTIQVAEPFVSVHNMDLHLIHARLLALQKKEAEALNLIEGLKCRFHKTELQEIYLVEAFIYESMKDFEKMFYTLKEVLTTNPNNSKALQQIWVSVEFSKKYEESVELHQKIIDINPYSYLAWYNLGHAYSCLGEYEKALEALEYSFLINPRFEQGYLDCAELSLQVGMYEKAYTCYEEANEMFGPDTELIAFMAECLIKLRRFPDAKKLLKQSVHQDPYNDEVFFYLGECYTHEHNWQKALENFLEAISLDEYREEFHAGAALAYENLGMLKKAELHYGKAARIGQEQSQYWSDYIKFLIRRENYVKAKKVLDKADKYSVGPDLVCCRIALLLQSGSEREAHALIEELLQDYPEQIHHLYGILPELKEDRRILAMVRYFSYSE